MKNTKLYTKGLALLTTVVLGLSTYSLAKADSVYRGDSVTTTTKINMRLGPSTDYFRLGRIGKDEICDRLMTIDGFDLVRYNGRIFFLSSDYTNSDIPDYNYEYYSIEEDSDIIRTTTEVYFRLGPSKSEQAIRL